MKKEEILALENDIVQQIQIFETKLLDSKSIEESKLKKLNKNVHSIVDKFIKQKYEDVNLWVFLKYRDGKVLSKKSKIVKLEPVALCDAIYNGFTIPETATILEFEIKSVWEKEYDRNVDPNNVYEIKFGLYNGDNLTVEQFKRRYKLTASDNLYSLEDLKENSKILKISSTKKKLKKQISVEAEESQLGL